MLSTAGRYHFLYFVVAIFFGSFYLVNLILAIVSMSYLQQQKKVQAENEERERQKIEDELDSHDAETRIASEADPLLHLEHTQRGEVRVDFFLLSNNRIKFSGKYDEHDCIWCNSNIILGRNTIKLSRWREEK